MDTVAGSMHQRFLKNGTLYADLALLDPKNFSQVTSCGEGFPEAALQELSKCLLPFDDRATEAELQSELSNLLLPSSEAVQSRPFNSETASHSHHLG